jgi:hypothetical protein
LQGTLIQNSAIDISFSPYMPQRGSPEQAGVNQVCANHGDVCCSCCT